jgi:formylglycine-generating enzyme required for sulfatase activity
VSWIDAKAYANWLGRMTGKPYRLLSEAEWEHAARAGGDGPYPTGETIGFGAAAFDDDVHEPLVGPLAVGSHPPNRFNLHDMAGNVWELVEDCWTDTHKDVTLDGQPILNGGDCRFRVMKGGAWYSEMSLLRPATRWANPARTAGNGVGFRVARP